MIPALRRPVPARQWTALAGSALIVALSVVPALFAHPRPNYDSIRYLAPPSLSSGQLPLVPAVFALAAHNPVAIGVVQALVGGACWCFLVSEVARHAHPLARVLGVTAVVLVACSTYVVQWYAALLSDSLSISLLALMVALGARQLRAGGSLWPLTVASGLWALTRATNAYILVLGAILLAPLVLLRRRRAVPHLACVLIVAGSATYLSGQGQLWKQPFFHSLTERILPDPSFRAWFAAHHMPLGPALRSLAGPYYPYKDAALYHGPALAGFRQWLDRSGQATYTEFLVTHASWVVKGTFSRHEELHPSLISYYGGSVSRSWYPGPLRDVLLSHRQSEMLAALGVAAAVVLAVAFRRRLRAMAAPAAAWTYVIGLGVLTLALDWAGDSWEVGRHSVDGTIAVLLAAIMLAASSPPTGAGSRPGSAEERLPQPASGSCPPFDPVPS